MAIDTDKSSIKCGFLNIQSVGNKTLNIRDLIKDNNFDIFALAETWLNEYDNAKIREMTPVTHSFLHVPRVDRRGGGVGIFLSNSFKKIRIVETEKRESFEHMQVSWEVSGRKFTFIVVYRPPHTRAGLFIEEFQIYLESVDMVSANVFICGDFNIWVDDENNGSATEFIEMMNSLNLENKVNRATSVSGHTLDLVFCDMDHNLVQDLNVDGICCISPVHMLVTFIIPYKKEKKQLRKITFRRKSNFVPEDLIRRATLQISEGKYLTCEHGLEVMKCAACLPLLYNNTVKDSYNETCPIIEKEIIVKDHAPWFNGEILRAKREKRQKERQWRRLRTDAARREFQNKRNEENRLVMLRKRDYFMQKTVEAGSNINKLYLILDSLTGNKKTNKLPEGFTDEELANKFLEFFDIKIRNVVRTFKQVNENRERTGMQVTENKLLRFRPIDVDVIKNIMGQLKLTYCDWDPLPISDIIKSENFVDIQRIFVEIVNIGIKNKSYPDSEKHAIVKPTVKGKLDAQCLSSYRPVSNLTFLSKVIEKVILDQLLDHLRVVEVIPDNQSAYRPLYSTETALCSVVNDLLMLMDQGKCGILILLDLSAAFDTVVHSFLLDDCKEIGIDEDALDYLRSYLENRTYCVQIGKSFSATKPLTRGVPQGSVLGPILFSIYTIGLSHLLRRHGVEFKLFADDTQFYFSLSGVHDTEEKLFEIMQDVKKWMDSKQLKLNEDKTECLIVGRKNDLKEFGISSLRMHETTVEVKTVVRDLGVLFDCHLSFCNQINSVVKVAGCHLKNIAFVRRYLDEKTTKMLIHNHVLTKLDYCNSLYYKLPNYQLKKLQCIMNRAARLIKGLSPRERITPILIDLHWLPIKARIIYKICVMTYQAIKFEKPKYMRELLRGFQLQTSMFLRHSADPHRLDEPRSNLEIGTRGFMRCAPRLYNRLPEDIKSSENQEIFKKRLKTHLFIECYDLEEKSIRDYYKC